MALRIPDDRHPNERPESDPPVYIMFCRFGTARSVEDRIVRSKFIFFTKPCIKPSMEINGSSLHVDDVVKRVSAGSLLPESFSKMKVVKYGGHLWTESNKRLWVRYQVLRKAKVEFLNVKVIKYDAEPAKSLFRRHAPNWYETFGDPCFFPHVIEKLTETSDYDCPLLHSDTSTSTKRMMLPSVDTSAQTTTSEAAPALLP